MFINIDIFWNTKIEISGILVFIFLSNHKGSTYRVKFVMIVYL